MISQQVTVFITHWLLTDYYAILITRWTGKSTWSLSNGAGVNKETLCSNSLTWWLIWEMTKVQWNLIIISVILSIKILPVIILIEIVIFSSYLICMTHKGFDSYWLTYAYFQHPLISSSTYVFSPTQNEIVLGKMSEHSLIIWPSTSPFVIIVWKNTYYTT